MRKELLMTSAYIRIVEICKELGIIQNDYLTEEELVILLSELLKYLSDLNLVEE